MTITTLSSRGFRQGIGRAKRAALQGAVLITDRGSPTHVLLSNKNYQRLIAGHRTLAEALWMPGVEDIEFDPPRIDIRRRIPDFD